MLNTIKLKYPKLFPINKNNKEYIQNLSMQLKEIQSNNICVVSNDTNYKETFLAFILSRPMTYGIVDYEVFNISDMIDIYVGKNDDYYNISKLEFDQLFVFHTGLEPINKQVNNYTAYALSRRLEKINIIHITRVNNELSKLLKDLGFTFVEANNATIKPSTKRATYNNDLF